MTQLEKTRRCLNCDYELLTEHKYCPNCGQENKSLKIDFKHLIGEIFGTYFNLDSKFLKSLVPLLFNPGNLTLHFLEGKRARYIPPIRLYIVISILYFFTLTLESRFNMDSSFNAQESDLSFMSEDTVTFGSSIEFMESVERQGMTAFLDSIGAHTTFEKFAVMQTYKVAQNKGEGLWDQILSNVSILMFFLLPFFALLLKVFFKKQKHYYNEHLVFSFHLHAFIFIFLAMYNLVTTYILNISSFVFILIVVFLYTVFASKKVYKYSYKATIGKLIGLLAVYNFVLVCGLLITIIISVALY